MSRHRASWRTRARLALKNLVASVGGFSDPELTRRLNQSRAVAGLDPVPVGRHRKLIELTEGKVPGDGH